MRVFHRSRPIWWRGAAAAVAVAGLLTAFDGPAGASTTPAPSLPWNPPPVTVSMPGLGAGGPLQFGGNIVNFDYTGWGAKAEGLWPPAPLGLTRIWDDQTTWANVEPSRGSWDFSLLDTQVAGALAHGSQVLYVLGQTPYWATSDTSSHDWVGWGAAAPPLNIDDWKQYVQTVVLRYKGKVASYELWDEADGSTYSGTAAQMVQMARVAYQTIKQIDPGAVVLTPSFTQNAIAGGGIAKYFAAGGGNYADAFAGHAYPKTPELGASLLMQYRALLAKLGSRMPVWITETGYTGFSSAGQALFSSTGAQAFVARTLMDQFEGGAARVVWYGANSNSLWLSLGEQGYADDATAYQSMVSWLAGSTPDGCGGIVSGIYKGLSGCYVTQASGAQAVMLYDAQGTLQMSSPSNTSVLVTSLSGTSVVDAPGTTITIGAVPVLVSLS